MTSFKILKLNQRISASVQGTPRRGNEHIAQGYALAGPSARSLNACQLQVNTCACLNDLILEEQKKRERLRRKPSLRHSLFSVCEITDLSRGYYFLLRARSTFTAHATEHPTMGLLPIPRKPIISTCAGTDEEPAN